MLHSTFENNKETTMGQGLVIVALHHYSCIINNVFFTYMLWSDTKTPYLTGNSYSRQDINTHVFTHIIRSTFIFQNDFCSGN